MSNKIKKRGATLTRVEELSSGGGKSLGKGKKTVTRIHRRKKISTRERGVFYPSSFLRGGELQGED